MADAGIQPKELGERVKRARITNGLSQAELADEIGMSQAYVSMIESGKKIPRNAVVRNIADAVNLHPADLWGTGADFEKNILRNLMHGMTRESVRKIVDYGMMVKLWQETKGLETINQKDYEDQQRRNAHHR